MIIAMQSAKHDKTNRHLFKYNQRHTIGEIFFFVNAFRNKIQHYNIKRVEI